MSDQPTDLPAVPEIPVPEVPVPDPVVFPSDGTPYAAPVTPDPVPAEPAPVDGPLSVAVPEVVAPAGGQLLTLPSGYKVAMRPTRSVRSRERKSLFVGVDLESNDALSMGMEILANVQRLMIVGWDVRDFDDATGAPVGDVLPVPSTTSEDVLGGLSLEDANALDGATSEIQKVLLPNFAPTATPDPSSPTPPSAG